MVANHCDAGLATDGDADRIGAVAEDGSLVDAHKCYAVLLEWLLKRKQWPGAVTRAFNTTGMLDRIAKAYGRELIEHGIGFKYVAGDCAQRQAGTDWRRGVGQHRHSQVSCPSAMAR